MEQQPETQPYSKTADGTPLYFVAACAIETIAVTEDGRYYIRERGTGDGWCYAPGWMPFR
jgi:hypothetical protein